MKNIQRKTNTGQSKELWPVIILLSLIVIVPTIGLLWFMTKAVQNERIVVRQKVSDIYKSYLKNVKADIDDFWKNKISAIAKGKKNITAGDHFAYFIKNEFADSVIIYDNKGQLLYPAGSNVKDLDEFKFEKIIQTKTLEYTNPKPEETAAIYAEISENSKNINLKAQALQGQIRSLIKGGQIKKALHIITNEFNNIKYCNALDSNGRLILPNIQLLALQLMDPAEKAYQTTKEKLLEQVRDYSNKLLSSSQRCFLMQQLKEIDSNIKFPTFAAEELALEYLTLKLPRPDNLRLAYVTKNKLLHFSLPDQNVVLLFKQERLLSDLKFLLKDNALLSDVTIELMLKANEKKKEPFLRLPIDGYMPDWELCMYLNKANPFAEVADKQITTYIWVGALTVFVIIFLTLLIVNHIVKQIRITRLKNNFLATVSHELKTPLASMRVLVDTLLEGNYNGEEQARKYLNLIAKENKRLSSLIDNFLTFSRMERNKQNFHFTELEPGEIIQTAIDSVHERFEAASCTLKVEINPGLPKINGDKDAMVTVLLNLLDNAFKYSDDNICISIRGMSVDKYICFQVEDNGIGLSARDTKKILERFYQVDQTLSRQREGCGLGLSIVDFIVKSHGGSIEINSKLGQGSVFNILIPSVLE